MEARLTDGRERDDQIHFQEDLEEVEVCCEHGGVAWNPDLACVASGLYSPAKRVGWNQDHLLG